MKANMKWEAAVASDVFEGPINEDGERPECLVYYVVLTDERGNRYSSARTWCSMHRNQRAEAERGAEQHLRRVRAALAKGATPVNNYKWERTRPMYGSEAYEAYGQAEEVALEKKEAGY